jgi:hypothetical protein
MTPVPSYIVNGETKEAYTITYSLPRIDTKDGSGIINIANTFNNAEGIISVKPYNNSLTIKTDKNTYAEITLKKMDSDYTNNEVVYKNTYSDIYYNLKINSTPETISHIIAGKYEINTTNTLFEIENVELLDNEYVSLVEENGKYYVIIEETSNDAYGVVTINLAEKEHIGYQSGPDVSNIIENAIHKANNYWKTKILEITETNAKSKMSRKIAVPEE